MEYTTLKRLSEISSLSENYLYGEVRSGNLAHSRCGRAIRVSMSDFEAFMAARRVGGEPPTLSVPHTPHTHRAATAR